MNVIKLYGVHNAERNCPIRTTIIIDREGVVRFINPEFDPRDPDTTPRCSRSWKSSRSQSPSQCQAPNVSLSVPCCHPERSEGSPDVRVCHVASR